MAKKSKKIPSKTFYLPAPPPPPPPPPPSDADSDQLQQTPAIPIPPSEIPFPRLRPSGPAIFTADPVRVKTWGPSIRIHRPPTPPKPKIKDGYLIRPKSKKTPDVVDGKPGVGGLIVGEEAGLNPNQANVADTLAASINGAQEEKTMQVTLEGREETWTTEMKEELEGGVIRTYWVTTHTSTTWQTEKPLAEGEGPDSEDDSDDDSDDESGTESESSESSDDD